MRIKGRLPGLPDEWLPLLRAPLFYGMSGFLETTEKWVEYVRTKVDTYAIRGVETLTWSRPGQQIEAFGFCSAKISSTLRADIGRVVVESHNEIPEALREEVASDLKAAIRASKLKFDHRVSIVRSAEDFIQHDFFHYWRASEGRRLDPEARLHCRMMRVVIRTLHSDFRQAVRTGHAVIMARKANVLAPFEAIAPDQWTHFKLDTLDGAEVSWHARTFCHDRDRVVDPEFVTATGPNGERLYSICVAPGQPVRSSSEDIPDEPETQCERYLVQLVQQFPEGAPNTKGRIRAETLGKFPGLGIRAFDRALGSALRDLGKMNWFKKGRPRKNADVKANDKNKR